MPSWRLAAFVADRLLVDVDELLELLERGFVLSGYLRGSIGEQGEKPRITFYFYPVVQKKPKKHVKRLFRKLASGEHHVETYRRDDNGVLGLYLKPLHLLRLEQRSS